jgi:hypothetical protein
MEERDCNVETPVVEAHETTEPEVEIPEILDNAAENATGVFGNIRNAGQKFWDKAGGKGFLGAGAGAVTALAVFKTKSPVMMIVMTGGGFLAERAIVSRMSKKSAEGSFVETQVMPEARVRPEPDAAPQASAGAVPPPPEPTPADRFELACVDEILAFYNQQSEQPQQSSECGLGE